MTAAWGGTTSNRSIHKSIRERLPGFAELSDDALLKEFRERQRTVCKPCWELKYCPYGPLVEGYPLLPPARAEVEDHIEYLREALRTGRMGDGLPLDAHRREWFERQIDEHDPEDYPQFIPSLLGALSCGMYGHMCPVFFTAEPITETSEPRHQGRSIPFPIRSRIARRDNYTCQSCGKHLRDEELEFDHVIPLSKGGSSDEHNLRLTCLGCNRSKGKRYEP